MTMQSHTESELHWFINFIQFQAYTMIFIVSFAIFGATVNAASLLDKIKSAKAPESYWWDAETCGRSKYPDAGSHALTKYMVVGGEEARPYEFPWIVSLQNRPGGSHFCGGSLITPNWVITAAHCVYGDQPTSLQVSAGEHSRRSDSEVRQVVNVQQIIVHESYDSVTTNNDIALLRLSTPVTFTENVTAVCAPPTTDTSLYYDHECQIMGWGTLRPGGLCCPDTLQWTWVDVTNQTECQRNYPGDITDAMVCAGVGNYQEKDTCQGDSGGPLTVLNANGQFELVGLTSWGEGCASGKPGVYANVPYFREWVTNQLAANP